MPTPVGHAIGGLAAAWLVQSVSRNTRIAMVCVFAAVLPDIDLLVESHRTYTHSLGAVAIAGGVAWLVFRRSLPTALPAAMAVAAAGGSHSLLDWLGKDSSNPPGLMVLWPFSSRFYISGWDVFAEVSRRYWNPDEFVFGNLRAVGRELLILGPVLMVVWLVRARRSRSHFDR